MVRLLILGVSFGLTLGALVGASYLAFRTDANAAGGAAFGDRRLLARAEEPWPAGRARVAWLGDSTLNLGHEDETIGYPARIDERSTLVANRVFNTPGMDPFGYYFLLEPVLAMRPDGIVLIANTRLLHGRGAKDVSVLADRLPLSELPRAAWLPLHARGLTVPRLLLLQALADERVVGVLRVLDGLRRLYQEAPIWARWDPSPPPLIVSLVSFSRGVTQFVLEAYDQPISARTSGVQMLVATLERIRAAGIPALVIVTPMPIERLQESHLYDADRTRDRLAALRAAVEGAGGQLLDLHDFLPRALFRDLSGHATLDGQSQLADRIRPEVERLVAGRAAAR